MLFGNDELYRIVGNGTSRGQTGNHFAQQPRLPLVLQSEGLDKRGVQ